MDRTDITAHGFRSTFRDWAAERTNYPNHVVEQALAHTIGNAVEAAYRRGDLFEKRRHLMDDWAAYCTAEPQAKATALPLLRLQQLVAQHCRAHGCNTGQHVLRTSATEKGAPPERGARPSGVVRCRLQYISQSHGAGCRLRPYFAT